MSYQCRKITHLIGHKKVQKLRNEPHSTYNKREIYLTKSKNYNLQFMVITFDVHQNIERYVHKK